jgi:hypothetical protein
MQAAFAIPLGGYNPVQNVKLCILIKILMFPKVELLAPDKIKPCQQISG